MNTPARALSFFMAFAAILGGILLAGRFWRSIANPQAENTSIALQNAEMTPFQPATGITGVEHDSPSQEPDHHKHPSLPLNHSGIRPYGPTEASLIRDGRINQQAMAVLSSSEFDRWLTRLERENTDTGERGGAYRAELQRQFDGLPQSLRLDRFVCGIDLCVGSIRTPKDSTDYRTWYSQLQANSLLPIPVLTEVVTDMGDQEDHRILLSTRPSTMGISGSANRPPLN